MKTEELNLDTSWTTPVRVNHTKNFSLHLDGFDNVDTEYELTLVNEEDESDTVVFVSGTDILMFPAEKKVSIVLQGNRFQCGQYYGELKSVNKDAEFFYLQKITIKFT